MTSVGPALRRKRIFFVHPRSAPFIASDLDILRRHYEVRSLDLGSYKRSLKNTIMVGYRLLRGVLWADASFSWFAERHAKATIMFSRLLGRPSVVVVGGYEVASIPEIGYGSMLEPGKAKMVKYTLERATAVLAVSRFIEGRIRSCSSPKRVEVVYNGVDTQRFSPALQKEALVVTVAVISKDTIMLKGLKTFIDAAAAIPEARFLIIGSSQDGAVEQLRAKAPKNLEFTGQVSNEKIAELYARAKVYCQLSAYEGFGVSLVESMCCGCVPVVTDAGALPEVVGDSGLIVKYGDVPATVEAIRRALRLSDGTKAVERARSSFSIESRENELVRIIGQLTE